MKNNNKKYEDELKFKDLKKDPKRLFGWIFPYFLFVLLILGIFYVKNIDNISFNTVPINPPVKDEVKREIKMKKGTVVPPVDLSIMQNPSAKLVEDGQKLFQANCASCHGDKGLGDGPAGASLTPPPRNFTVKDGWVNGRQFPDMYRTLEEGIAGSGMSAYEYISPKDRIAIIEYIRTFTDFPKITDEQVAALNTTYNLSEGTKTPNQIPVSLAIKTLIEEKDNQKKISSLISFVNNNQNMDGTTVFNTVVSDKEKVFTAFLDNNFMDMSLDKFINTIIANPIELGFNGSVTTMNRTEWAELYEYMKNIIRTAEG